ncbi:uncharacterized protein [Argopecten irradians]|uniref:uncharacterized protein n=1 Tax=Argopecten irradians TaxID=31199 RepID=UPI003721E15B
MDFKNALIMCVQVVIAISSVVPVITGTHKNRVSTKTRQHGRAKHLNEVNSPHSQDNVIVKGPSLVENVAETSHAKVKNCCRNGGRCILNSFCHCPKNFYGRYCQYEYKNRSCGELKSGHFIRSDCDLCRCFDGFMYCIPRIYPGCENEGFVDHTKKIDPFKGKDIEIIPDKIDQQSMNLRTSDIEKDYAYYYDYEGTEKNTAARITGSYVKLTILLPTIAFCIISMLL